MRTLTKYRIFMDKKYRHWNNIGIMFVLCCFTTWWPKYWNVVIITGSFGAANWLTFFIAVVAVAAIILTILKFGKKHFNWWSIGSDVTFVFDSVWTLTTRSQLPKKTPLRIFFIKLDSPGLFNFLFSSINAKIVY